MIGRRPWDLECALCRRVAAGFGYGCLSCDGPLVVRPAPAASSAPADLLPEAGELVDLGQGSTPLVALRGHAGVFLKLESLNPTLSFKDRAMALGAGYAVRTGAAGLVAASTGNAAVSAAAYAAAAGLRCRLLVGSASRAARKMDACRAYGATVAEVPGDYSDAYREAAAAEGEGWLNVSTTYRNPILAEAYRLIAFELLRDLGAPPATVVVPIGAGPLLRGIERGFADAVDLGLIGRPPRMVGVQAAAVAPIAQAWAAADGSGALGDGAPADVVPSKPAPATAATAIADPLRGYESHGRVTIEAVRRTGGSVVAVDEPAIADATRRLAAAGFWVEPSAATALAALELPAIDAVEGPVVLLATGHGAKVGGGG